MYSAANAWIARLQRLPRPLVLLALSLCVFLLARLCLALPREGGRIAPIWLSNALMLAVLLRSPSRRWTELLIAGVLGHGAASLSAGNPPLAVLILVSSSGLEYIGTALILRRVLGTHVEMERAKDLAALCILAAIMSVVAAGVESLSLRMFLHDRWAGAFRAWCVSHPLSLMLVTPSLLVLSQPRKHLPGARLALRTFGALFAMFAVACIIFLQDRFPLLFLAPPILLAVSLEAGLFGAAVAVLLTAAVAVPATILGHGPIALSHSDLLDKVAVLQLFLVVTLWTSIPVAGLQARQRKTQARAVDEARNARAAEAQALAHEAQLRAITDQASDAICTFDLAGVVTFASPAAETLTGYAPEELVGRRNSDFVCEDDRSLVAAAAMAVLAGHAATGASIDYRFRHKSGGWIWLQANPTLIRSASGTPTGFVDVIRDISQRKAAEAHLDAAREAAIAAAKAKTDFLANMSHELRTPLTGILGYAEILAGDRALSAESRTYAQRIGVAGSTLLSLVNDVLDFSKFEAQGVQLAPCPTQLQQLLQGAMELVRSQAQAKSLALCLDCENVPALALVDPGRLQQVLVNLLGNAIKFTPSGVVTLALSCERRGYMLKTRIAIIDTGIGIPAHRLPRIFDRFEQADASTSRRYGGTGLGLAISSQIVEAMGGRIEVESAPGAGSVFCIRLELPSAEAVAPQAVDPAPPNTSDAPAAQLRVLLAEDVAINRDLIALFLKPLGVELHLACNGAEAVTAAELIVFDVILMDMQMPVLDGLEATRRIRAGAGPSRHAPILALTANVLPGEVGACLEAGMDGHIAKPVTARRLADALRSITVEGRLPQARQQTA